MWMDTYLSQELTVIFISVSHVFNIHFYTGCPTRYRNRHFFNNSNTNEDIATKFEHKYVIFFHISYTMRWVRFKFLCHILISGNIIKEMPGSVASGTLCIFLTLFIVYFNDSFLFLSDCTELHIFFSLECNTGNKLLHIRLVVHRIPTYISS
jgi:hypothetical protein